MALICNECTVTGRKPQRITCKHTGLPCAFLRYCALSMKYYQTDAAKNCKLRRPPVEKRPVGSGLVRKTNKIGGMTWKLDTCKCRM